MSSITKIFLIVGLLTGASSYADENVSVYCKSIDSHAALVRGPNVLLGNRQFDISLRDALNRLWSLCGGRRNNRCEKPATCYIVNKSGVEIELGKFN